MSEWCHPQDLFRDALQLDLLGDCSRELFLSRVERERDRLQIVIQDAYGGRSTIRGRVRVHAVNGQRHAAGFVGAAMMYRRKPEVTSG